MKTRTKIGLMIILLGTGASLGNYLWLIGVLPKPEAELESTRWIYTVCAYIAGAIIAFFEP